MEGERKTDLLSLVLQMHPVAVWWYVVLEDSA